jgi:hypothetical protein
VGNLYNLSSQLLRVVVLYFTLLERSNRLATFRSRRMKLYNLLRPQRSKRRSVDSLLRKRNNACLKSEREIEHLSENYGCWSRAKETTEGRGATSKGGGSPASK